MKPESHSVVRIDTKALAMIFEPVFHTSGAMLLGPAAFLDFRVLIAVRISASFGAAVLILKGVGLQAAGWLCLF